MDHTPTPAPDRTSSFALAPIDPDTSNQLRASGGEIYTADRVPGFPCRQCLRDADIGDELLLVSHDPFAIDSPYRSRSPIFLHRQDCGGPVDATGSELPHQLLRRRLSVRSFDNRAMMIDAAVVDGPDLESTIDRFFGDPSSARLHVHNAERGCWAVTVTRD